MDNFFFKTKTHRVLTWPARGILLVCVVVGVYFLIPAAKHAVVWFTVDVDRPAPTAHLVVENWDASIDVFEQANAIAAEVGHPEIWGMVNMPTYFGERTRRESMANAWAAGIDTSRFRLLLVPPKEPKTLNNAKAIIDTASKLGWKELTLATAVFHSGRSKKALLYFAEQKGIAVRVLPWFEAGATLSDWYETDAGQAAAFNEFLKMFFYDIYVFKLHTFG